MSVLSSESFYWVNNSEGEIIYIPARYTVDSEGNAICTHTFSLEHAFDECTSVDDYGLYYAFYGCTGITGSISFPKLTSIGSRGLCYAFYGCTGITSVSFPKLTTIGNSGLNYAFYNCTGITEIHFRSDAQSTVEAASSYSSKFGASNATIYFDL